MAEATLESAIDALYGSPLEEFTRERARLAKELRAAANPDADTVAKLRKPSVAAWILNQLARRNRRDIDLLLDAGHRLRETQVAVIGGAEKQEFERARKAEFDALRRLTTDAEKLLAERGTVSAAVVKQVVETLRAAAVSPSGRELLARGRFTQPLEASGFDVFAELANANSGARPRSKQRQDKHHEVQAARQAVRESKQRVRAAEKKLRDTEKALTHLRAEIEATERRAQREQDELDEAIRKLEDAETRAG
jgi:hypothetical protein